MSLIFSGNLLTIKDKKYGEIITLVVTEKQLKYLEILEQTP